MVSVICTAMVCATVLVTVRLVLNSFEKSKQQPAQQPMISEEELNKALRDTSDIPNFQDVINYINKEFTGVEDENEEE